MSQSSTRKRVLSVLAAILLSASVGSFLWLKKPADRPVPTSAIALQKAESYAIKQLEHFQPLPAVQEQSSPADKTQQRFKTFRSLLITLPKLDRSPYRVKYRDRIFAELDKDPGFRDLAVQILADVESTNKLFGKDQGMSRVIAVDYLSHLDRNAPQSGAIIEGLKAIHKRLDAAAPGELDKGTTADLQELYMAFFKHRLDEVQHQTIALLEDLPFSSASYAAFRPMIGYYVNSMPTDQAKAVLKYIKSRTQN